MQDLTVKIKRACILRGLGTDRVSLELDSPTPFPETKYEAVFRLETRKGYAEEWLSLMGITTWELVQTGEY